ncbi:hypothetical protein CFC21_060935 [Triticum aestivum]|uniref:Uncharacterized protein n=3 Tax=Triticinae TaxID=1648030 RepID=A0A453HJL9_AEGTS|nr:uncharacterized protein LOC123099652 [Triticum aestivum]KAF7052913.1 hypothetical protein CFC21_060935 [Triticum aestivum]
MTTMDSLKDDNVEEILLRLPSWAPLGHAVRASGRLRRVASNPGFLRCFRARHASSSPHGFLGVFSRWQPSGLPLFHLAGPARSDPGLVAIAHAGDFLLACLEDDPAWRLHDCRNGRLLLSRGRGSLSVYDPISLRRIDIDRPHDDPFPDGYIADANCLVDDGDASFRVVSLQVDGRRRLRAVEYDSRSHGWRFHPWAADTVTAPPAYQTMYAAGLMFWNHDGDTAGASSLLLDTRTRDFSMLPLPAAISEARSNTRDRRRQVLPCVRQGPPAATVATQGEPWWSQPQYLGVGEGKAMDGAAWRILPGAARREGGRRTSHRLGRHCRRGVVSSLCH